MNDSFDPRSYGAVADGHSKDTIAVQAAIDAAAAPYPEVPDRLQAPTAPGSENYYPDWSRTTHLDARNVRGLTLENLHFNTLHPDERPKMLTEGFETVT